MYKKVKVGKLAWVQTTPACPFLPKEGAPICSCLMRLKTPSDPTAAPSYHARTQRQSVAAASHGTSRRLSAGHAAPACVRCPICHKLFLDSFFRSCLFVRRRAPPHPFSGLSDPWGNCLPPPYFDKYVNPIRIKGVYYAHHILRFSLSLLSFRQTTRPSLSFLGPLELGGQWAISPLPRFWPIQKQNLFHLKHCVI